MSIMCAYQNCLCVKYPCSSTAFFRLPSDSRRSIWIKNSGNKSLKNISKNAHRFFCENHFRECDIRTQFNRKILRRHAVPIEHNDLRDSILLTKGFEQQCTKLSRDEGQQNKLNTHSNLVVEKLEVDANISHYDDGEMQELENDKNHELVDDELNNFCTILDFYTHRPCEDNDHYAESYSKEIIERSDLDEIVYEVSGTHRTDSSTINLQYIAVAEDVDSEAETPLNHANQIEDVSLEANGSNHIASSSNDSNHIASLSNDYQEDRHFALSLVGYFQRLPKDKRALAKLKILQYLTDLNIGLSSDL